LHSRSKPPRSQGDASGPNDWRARIDERAGIRVSAKLIRANGSSQKVIITNESANGIGLEGVDGIGIGETALLVGEDSQVREIKIRWVVGNQAGARFVGAAD
jgi:hypothetical protein